MNPIFKKKEIVVREKDLPKAELGGGSKEVVAEVIYKGAKCEDYDIGNKIFFNIDKVPHKKTNYFGESLIIIENEAYIICQIEE